MKLQNTPPIQDSAESPQELLHGATSEVQFHLQRWLGDAPETTRALVVAMEARRRAVARLEDLRADDMVVDTTAHEKTAEEKIDAARALLDRVVFAGLEERVGYRLNYHDRIIFDLLMKFGASQPRGVAVCRDCVRVFTPKRKGFAERCDECHRHPPAEWVITDDRMEWPRLRVELGDDLYPPPGGEFVGWTRRRFLRCKECGCLFETTRIDAISCSGACTQARKRRRDSGDDAELGPAAQALRAEKERLRSLGVF